MNASKRNTNSWFSYVLYYLSCSLFHLSTVSVYAQPYDLHKKLIRLEELPRLNHQGKAVIVPDIKAFNDSYKKLIQRCHDLYSQSNQDKGKRQRASKTAQTEISESSAQWTIEVSHLKISLYGAEFTRFYQINGATKHITRLPAWSAMTEQYPSIRRLSKLSLPPLGKSNKPKNTKENELLLGIEWSYISTPSLQSLTGNQRIFHLAHHRYSSQCVLVDISTKLLASPTGMISRFFTKGRSPSLMKTVNGALEAYSYHLNSEAYFEAQSFLIWQVLE